MSREFDMTKSFIRRCILDKIENKKQFPKGFFSQADENDIEIMLTVLYKEIVNIKKKDVINMNHRDFVKNYGLFKIVEGRVRHDEVIRCLQRIYNFKNNELFIAREERCRFCKFTYSCGVDLF